MRAMILTKYGAIDDIAPGEVPAPTPAADEVLIRVRGAAVNPADAKVATGKVKFLHGRRFPMVLGYDFAGVVEQVGAGVATYRSGDEVYGFLPYGGGNNQGSYGELVTAKAAAVAARPRSVGFVEAASTATVALTALQAIRPYLAGCARPRVLVNGASGGVGSYAVQIARQLGARVDGTCSGSSVRFVESLGAERVFDYRVTPIETIPAESSAGGAGPAGYDLVLDAASNSSFGKTRRLLRAGGTYVTLLPSGSLLTGFLASLVTSQRARFAIVKSTTHDLRQVAEWIDSGAVRVFVDETFALTDVVKAIHRAEKGGVKGKIGVQVG